MFDPTNSYCIKLKLFFHHAGTIHFSKFIGNGGNINFPKFIGNLVMKNRHEVARLQS